MPSPYSSSPAYAITLTGNPMVDGMLSGYKWDSGAISFSFPGPNSLFPNYPEPTVVAVVQAFNAVQQAAVVDMAKAMSNYAGVSMYQIAESVSSVGDLRLGFSASYTYVNGKPYVGFLPGRDAASGDEWMNPNTNDSYLGALTVGGMGASAFTPGSLGYEVAMITMLQGMGLKGPRTAYPAPYNGMQQPSAFAGFEYTVMSGFASALHPDVVGLTFFPTTPMVLDIQALQTLYGVNRLYNAGDTTYSFNDNKGQYYNQTLWDGGGSNTIAYSGSTTSTIDLRPGQGSFIGNRVYGFTTEQNQKLYETPNVWIAYGTKIDSATVSGTAAVTFIANDDGDTLTASSGNDSFTGGAGNDVMRGNAGNDILAGGAGADIAVYAGKQADYTLKFGAKPADPLTVTDTRKIVGNDGVDTLTGVERLQFADVAVAYDMAATDVAGKTALVMGATLGAWFTQDKTWAGLFLKYFDSGATVLQGTQLLVDAGIMAAFAGGADNASFVKFVYANVYGQAPDAATLASLVAPLDAHTTTQAAWMADMVLSLANQQHVNLTGLAASGWQYTL